MTYSRRKYRTYLLLLAATFIILVTFAACSVGIPSLHVKNMRLDPSPVVGVVSTLTIEIENSNDYDIQEVQLKIRPSEGVTVLGEQTSIQTTMKANERKTFEFTICVLEEGEHRIDTWLDGKLAEDTHIIHVDRLHLINRGKNAWAIPDSRYSSAPTPWGAKAPTPVPVTIDPDCLNTN